MSENNQISKDHILYDPISITFSLGTEAILYIKLKV